MAEKEHSCENCANHEPELTDAEKTQRLIDYARKEMFLAGLYDPQAEFKGKMPHCVEAILGVIGPTKINEKKHSILHIIDRITKMKPLIPLTGKEDEWEESGIDNETGFTFYQNKRLRTVFKDHTGQAYDLEGYVFEYPDGRRMWGGDKKNMKKVSFPYSPATDPEIIKLDENDKGYPEQ